MNLWNSYKIGFRVSPALSDNSALGSQRNRGIAKNSRLSLYRLVHRFVPIDYVRWREFSFSLEAIEKHVPSPRKILDISSPKLLPITFAASLKNSSVHSIDILESEVVSVENARRHLHLNNLTSERMDARSLRFPDNSFDLITSISVLEHIEPEKGGEEPVVREIHRVLSPEGIAIFTVPFSRTYFAEFREGTVYERKGRHDEKQFFQRFYDLDTLMKSIVKLSPMNLVSLGFIEERFFLKSPRKRSAHYFSGTAFRTMIFGPLYPLLSRIFLSRPKELKKCTKPYLACLVMKKP
jgi:ubiquinone/menaquinone biosynthesis C-methylase UbiE